MNDFFSQNKISNLNTIEKGALVHVIGVCGVAMAQIAVELSEQGYRVSGSDKEFYEPMGGFLRASHVALYQGYAAANIQSDVALVVIGNAVSFDNLEVQEVLRRQIAYTIFPKLLFDLVISGRHSIVVSGTHGKTTTSAMGAMALELLEQDPSYFIGGAARDLAKSLKQGANKVSIVEGDEYDSSFFAKVPKFAFYQPNTLIITSIEFDHADIYKDLASIELEFNKLVAGLAPGSTVIACVDCKNVRKLLPVWRNNQQIKILSYGAHSSAEFRLQDFSSTQDRSSAKIFSAGKVLAELALKVPGQYNLANALSILLAARGLGLELDMVIKALAEFNGVKRRQEVRFENKTVTLIEDFAHHPSAVLATLQGIAERYQGRRIVAVFEPRSNTSRRKVFQDDYVRAFTPAGLAILSRVGQRSVDVGQELLDVEQLAQEITKAGVRCQALDGADSIVECVIRENLPGDVIVVMSNGSFAGVIERILGELKL